MIKDLNCFKNILLKKAKNGFLKLALKTIENQGYCKRGLNQ
jgi:hypothetical protein